MSSHQLLWCCQAIYKALSKAEQSVVNGFQNIRSLGLCKDNELLVAKYHKKQLTIVYIKTKDAHSTEPVVMENVKAWVSGGKGLASPLNYSILLKTEDNPNKVTRVTMDVVTNTNGQLQLDLIMVDDGSDD
eukprot:GHVS01038822.1.p1 GENE.GHVS01038822.1~~GHVS01038822.1.p1  ORF type:complete len:131 (+),score=9.72 GHVS01038822.1:382-774(+)